MKQRWTWDQPVMSGTESGTEEQSGWPVEESTYNETRVGWHDMQSAIVMVLIVGTLFAGGFLLILYRQNQILDTVVTTCVPRVEVKETIGK